MDASRHLEAREAERAVLGGVMLKNDALETVAGMLTPEDFYEPRHGELFKHMLALKELERAIDPVTMGEYLEQKGALETLGGMEGLLAVADAVPTAINIEHHADIVRERSMVRQLINQCTGFATRASTGEYGDVKAFIDEAQAAIFALAKNSTSGSFTEMREALIETWKRLEAAYKTKSTITGTPTGFHDLDAMTAGWQPGDLIILAARPSMGKTALALNFATNCARDERPAVIFSLEMPTTQLVTRMLSTEARVSSELMRTGHITQDDLYKLAEGMQRMKGWPIHIDDTAGISIQEARARCRQLAAKTGGLGLVVVDYLQLMKSRGNINSREQEISDISRNLKALAKELEVPVIALSQLNRKVEERPDKRPMMSDLRESGAIEQDADVIMFVYRPEYYKREETPEEEKGIAEVIIAKQRNGPTGSARLLFLREFTRFENLAAGTP